VKRLGDLLRRAVIPALAVLTAFVLGGIVIVLTDFDHLQHIGTDPAGAIGGAIGGMLDAYAAMLSGAIGDQRDRLAREQQPKIAVSQRLERPRSVRGLRNPLHAPNLASLLQAE
jgi:ABC-type uncharacterized transport system permease subunit